jgi:hypothetical protein
MSTTDQPFGLSDIEINKLLERCLKPEEISGDGATQLDRVRELVKWFLRYADGNANPKWFQAHAFELVYYIATTASNRFIDLEKVREKSFWEGVNITPGERALLVKIN